MESFALATMLFVVYFCFYSWLFGSPELATESEMVLASPPPTPAEYREAFEVEPEDNLLECSEALVATEPSPDDLLASIKVDELDIRTARKVAKALDIRQKVNGKDKTLDWFKREIKQKLTSEPALARVVVKTLPSLVSQAS